MKIVEDSWLAGLMAQAVFRLDHADAEVDVRPLAAHIEQQARAFYFTKIDCATVEAVRRLTALGFFTADTNVLLKLDRTPVERAAASTIVSELRTGDEDALLEVAETTYELSRFHLDPLVPRAIANRIKREWAANYVRKARGDKLFVAYPSSGGTPIGFLAALRTPNSAVIDLVGVTQAARGQGAGSALVRAFCDHYTQAGVAELTVGTQVANIPSLRMYEKLGFSLSKSQYVLHLHVERGRPRSAP
jgi:ribosomal protein S18 acetylase RimI-like enzyme